MEDLEQLLYVLALEDKASPSNQEQANPQDGEEAAGQATSPGEGEAIPSMLSRILARMGNDSRTQPTNPSGEEDAEGITGHQANLKQVLQQLLHTIRSGLPNKREEIKKLLQSNSQLMQAFVKQRQIYQEFVKHRQKYQEAQALQVQSQDVSGMMQNQQLQPQLGHVMSPQQQQQVGHGLGMPSMCSELPLQEQLLYRQKVLVMRQRLLQRQTHFGQMMPDIDLVPPFTPLGPKMPQELQDKLHILEMRQQQLQQVGPDSSVWIHMTSQEQQQWYQQLQELRELWIEEWNKLQQQQ